MAIEHVAGTTEEAAPPAPDSNVDAAAREPPGLACLGGRPAPNEIATDLAILGSLPLAARQQLYGILGPCLALEPPSTIDAQIEQFCRVLGLDVAPFSKAIKASRFLVRNAAMLDLTESELSGDLAMLGDSSEVRSTLLPGYEAAKDAIRREMAYATLSDHGKLVERVDWRVDYVTSSNRGENFKLPIAVITLGYRQGDRQDRITLQLLPEALLQLKAMCDRLV